MTRRQANSVGRTLKTVGSTFNNNEKDTSSVRELKGCNRNEDTNLEAVDHCSSEDTRETTTPSDREGSCLRSR